jgi:hypothetical protein
MKNAGLKNELQVSKILTSGSLALRDIDKNGHHLFKDDDINDGIIAGSLLRPYYNIKELQKAVDTTISELLPIKQKPTPDVVLREIYDEALATINNQTNEIQELREHIIELNSRILELQLLNDSLLDENNSRVLQLEAMVNALTTERDLLRDQLFGRMARQQEGDIVGTDFSLRIVNKNEPDVDGLKYFRRANPNRSDGSRWINGGEIEIINFTGEDISVRIDIPNTEVHKLAIGSIKANDLIRLYPSTPNVFNIVQNSLVNVNFMMDEMSLNELPPVNPAIFISRTETYKFSIQATSLNSNSRVDLPVVIQKVRG